MKYADVKIQVNNLRKFLREKEITMILGHCYEAISRVHGYENWDTFSAILKNGGKQDVSEQKHIERNEF